MGRAKSNTKRRPKGKRGWRKIDVNSLINPSQKISLEEQQNKIEKLRDSQLWKQDISPRKLKKLTKAQKKLKAKNKLLSRGFTINSIESNTKFNQQIKTYKKKQRLLSFKQSQKPQNNIQPKQTAFINFPNKTYKKIALNNHKNMMLNKKNIKNTIDYHKNNQYHLYKIKHNHKNTKNAPIQDLWDDNDNSSKPSFNVSKCKLSGSRSVENNFVSTMTCISLPNAGESINPLSHEYYHLKWKALELKAKQIFTQQYQTKSTKKWYKNNLTVDQHSDDTIKELKKSANKMKKLYLKHLRLYKEQQRKRNNVNRMNGMDGMDAGRKISHKQMRKDLKSNRMNYNNRMNAIRKRIRLSAKTGGHIYGSKYRFKRRITPIMSGGKLNNCLRDTLHSGTDHPLSFMFNEMQKQNKIRGKRRNRFVFPKKKGFLGPSYKVQTRIGKLHHTNVHNRYFSGIDD